ncbi:unnamed protein product [Amoebophrya sp. A120]|nr:unnamed protein product [Amoebophrya sp. A120]|eukprot:GSA120T00022226001.1
MAPIDLRTGASAGGPDPMANTVLPPNAAKTQSQQQQLGPAAGANANAPPKSQPTAVTVNMNQKQPTPTAAQKKQPRWFHAANNYLSARHMAMRKFSLLMERVREKKWTNDRVLEFDDPEQTTQSSSQRVTIFDFPPSNDVSYYCINRNDPDSQVPDAAEPVEKWRRISEIHVKGRLFPINGKTHYGRVYQGGLQNFYLTCALQALSLRPKLLHDVFAYSSVERGIYVLTFYKNGQYCTSEVDDLMPVDAAGLPIAAVSEDYPYILWPTIVEKAYAKLHCNGKLDTVGWEIIGEGGCIEECLVDLTGGVGGFWYTCDVSVDRLFVYLHELQREAIFVAQINQKACDTRNVKLNPFFPYVINRVTEFEGNCYVQMFCGAPYLADGGLSDISVVPWNLTNDPRWGQAESTNDGFFWMSIFDFSTYFEIIHECRLVNSGDRGAIPHMPSPRLPIPVYPCYVSEPMFESVHACADLITMDYKPEFLLTYHPHFYGVAGGGGTANNQSRQAEQQIQQQLGNEVYICTMQTDERLSQSAAGTRFQHLPICLKVWERVVNTPQTLSAANVRQQQEKPEVTWSLVTKSNFQENARDSTACFKIPPLPPGSLASQYLVTCEFHDKIPEKNKFLADVKETPLPDGVDSDDVVVNRLIFRCYSTKPLTVAPRVQGSTRAKNLFLTDPGADYPKAIRWTLVGSRDPKQMLRPDLPDDWDDLEGCGVAFASRLNRRDLENMIGNSGAPDGNGNCAIM